nr:hypothetical protein HmN_000520000 [Hymenolepis microstoma]
MSKDIQEEPTLPSKVDDENPPEYVQTNYGVAYRFVTSVEDKERKDEQKILEEDQIIQEEPIVKSNSSVCPQSIINRINSLIDPKDMHDVKRLVHKRLFTVLLGRHLQRRHESQVSSVKTLPNGTVQTSYSIRVCAVSGVECYLEVQRNQSDLVPKKVERRSIFFKELILRRIEEFINSCDNIDALKRTREVILAKINEFNESCERMASYTRLQSSNDSSLNTEHAQRRRKSLPQEALRATDGGSSKGGSVMKNAPSHKTSTPITKDVKIVPMPTYKSPPPNSSKSVQVPSVTAVKGSPKQMVEKTRKNSDEFTESVNTSLRELLGSLPSGSFSEFRALGVMSVAESQEESAERPKESLEKSTEDLAGHASVPIEKCSEPLPDANTNEPSEPITNKTENLEIPPKSEIDKSPKKKTEIEGKGPNKGRRRGKRSKRRNAANVTKPPVPPITKSAQQRTQITVPRKKFAVGNKGGVSRLASKAKVPVGKSPVSMPPPRLTKAQIKAKLREANKRSRETKEGPSILLVCIIITVLLCFIVFQLLP